MELGTRIQALRKQRGLSQEALAEQMGLSRQAIGKWETGASAPSLDNLKELAKLLGTTADYLLTGKEPASPPPETPETISAEALQALLREQEQHRPINRGLIVFCVAAALIMLWFYMEFDRKIEHLQNSLTILNASVDDLSFFHKADVDAINSKLEAAPEQPALLTDYSVTCGQYHRETDTASVQLTAIPRTAAADTRLTFVLLPAADSENTLPESLSVEAQSSAAGVYTAEIQVPMVDSFTVYAMVEQEGLLQTQAMTAVYDFAAGYRCTMKADLGTFGISWSNDGTAAIHGTPAVTIRPAKGNGPIPTSLKCTLYMDDTAVFSEELQLHEFSPAPAEPNEPAATALEATYYPAAGTYDAFPHDGDPNVTWVFLLTDSLGNTYEETLNS